MSKQTDQVCQECGSSEIQMSGKHGWVVCDDCGCDGPAADYDDWVTSQEGPHMIPEGYAEP